MAGKQERGSLLSKLRTRLSSKLSELRNTRLLELAMVPAISRAACEHDALCTLNCLNQKRHRHVAVASMPSYNNIDASHLPRCLQT